MCYTPIVLYVYSYVILDYMYSKADSNVTNWFDNHLTFNDCAVSNWHMGHPLPPYYRDICLRIIAGGDVARYTRFRYA